MENVYLLRCHVTRIRGTSQAVSAEKRKKQARKPRMPRRWSPWSAGAPSYPARWHFGLFAACWGSHQPLFLGGAGQFLEHIRAEVFPDERILVEQSKAANLAPLRRFLGYRHTARAGGLSSWKSLRSAASVSESVTVLIILVGEGFCKSR